MKYLLTALITALIAGFIAYQAGYHSGSQTIIKQCKAEIEQINSEIESLITMYTQLNVVCQQIAEKCDTDK